jgi:hypothetical protein
VLVLLVLLMMAVMLMMVVRVLRGDCVAREGRPRREQEGGEDESCDRRELATRQRKRRLGRY